MTLCKGLKPHSFSRLAASPASYNRCRLAGVPASTHEPQIMRHTMLDLSRGAQSANLPGFVPRQDVDLSNNIAMRAETTPPAGIPPAAWFVPLGTVGTGLRCVVFVDQFYRDTFSFRLVGDVLADAAVIPLRGLLVVLLAMIDTIGNIPPSPIAIAPARRSTATSTTARLILCSMSRMTRLCLARIRVLARCKRL